MISSPASRCPKRGDVSVARIWRDECRYDHRMHGKAQVVRTAVRGLAICLQPAARSRSVVLRSSARIAQDRGRSQAACNPPLGTDRLEPGENSAGCRDVLLPAPYQRARPGAGAMR